MLVVSNIDLNTTTSLIKPSTFLKSSIKDTIINLNNDYRYLKTGYYVSMYAEVLGNSVIPTSENIIDANRTPILLLKASKAGIPTVPHVVTSSVNQMMATFDFPVAIFAVNPFSYDGFKIAKNRSALYRAVRSLSMNYKFAVCIEPVKGEMSTLKSVFGRCEAPEFKEVSRRVYETFRIPLCKLHVQSIKDTAYLCGLQPMKKEEITVSDLNIISEEISRLREKGEHLLG